MALSPPDSTKEGPKKEKSCWQCGRSFFTSLDLCPDDGARLIVVEPQEEKDPFLGTVFDGRFRILAKLGEGGMGSVYSAHRLDFDTTVALKLLKSDFARDEGIRKRFMYEARVISNLKHPHSVRLYDFGQTESGHVYMVMELLEGESLADRLSYRFVSYREVFDIIIPVCGVLGEAHLRDVVHRDLKPENIYLLRVEGNHEFPKLIDFGIAKHNRAETMTKSGTLWGTPAYMSPEQARGDKVGAPADIYGMGIMLYELISGNLPFNASTQMGFAVKHINEEPRGLSTIPGLHSVPEELDDFVLSMLAKDPRERPASMIEVSNRLEAIRENYFDDALLDSIPAEEVDPQGLQRWLSEAPDISQTIRAERSTSVDTNADTLVGGENFILLETSEKSRTGRQDSEETMVGEVPDLLTLKGLRKEKSVRGHHYWKVGAVVLVLLGIGLAGVFLFSSLYESEELSTLSEEAPEVIGAQAREPSRIEDGAPSSREVAATAATIQAVQVLLEARTLIQSLTNQPIGAEQEESFDFIHQAPVGEPLPPRRDEDSSLREKLEGTF